MFTKKDCEDDSNWSVDLTNDHQIYDADMFEISDELYHGVSFVFNETYDEDQFASEHVLHLETLYEKEVFVQTSSNYNSQFGLLRIHVNLKDWKDLSDVKTDIWPGKYRSLYNPRAIINESIRSIVMNQSMLRLELWNLSLPGQPRSVMEMNVVNRIKGRNCPISRHEIYGTQNLPLSEDCDRYDDLVERYHNNVHFMHILAQLLCDLILFRLPTSVHSQCTMLGAFAARSSQVDYGERKRLEGFCLNYQSSSALEYYTQDMFFYRVLNYILRQQRYDIIYQYRHVIIDVIERLRQPSPSDDDSVSLVLYRGQRMTILELEKMKNNVGEVVSTSSFLSTTMNPQIAQIFAGDGSDDNPCLVSVIFKIHLDTGQPMRPYALINKSAEEEVLFSPGTKFVLISCRKLHDNGRLWLFELRAISEKQQEQLELNHGETFLLLSSARGWPDRSWLFII